MRNAAWASISMYPHRSVLIVGVLVFGFVAGSQAGFDGGRGIAFDLGAPDAFGSVTAGYARAARLQSQR